MNKIEVLQGDAAELFKEIESESIDLIIADPPYNLGKDYGNNHDLKAFDDYLHFSSTWLKHAHRVLKPKQPEGSSDRVFFGRREIVETHSRASLRHSGCPVTALILTCGRS